MHLKKVNITLNCKQATSTAAFIRIPIKNIQICSKTFRLLIELALKIKYERTIVQS